MTPDQKDTQNNTETSKSVPPKQDLNEDLGEYSFEEPDYSSEYQPTAEEGSGKRLRTSPFSGLNKKIIIIIAIVALLFVSFRFFSSKKPKETPKPPPTPKAISKTPQQDILLGANVTSLQQQTKDNSDKISQLQRNVALLQSAINDIKGTVYNLNATTQKLSENVLHLVSSKRITAKRKKPSVLYRIRAIVPERAWLISNKGEIVTVRPGTKLKGYGRITDIFPSKGIVKTSSGFEISYGNKDI